MMRRLLAAAAAVVLLAGCDGSPAETGPTPSPPDGGASDATSATATAPPIDQEDAVDCPDDVTEPDPALPDAVPEGATSVRLCDGGADRVTPPVDALVTDVAAVVEKVNGQPAVSRGCADQQLPTYQLAFGYPDGTSFVVAGRFTGCAELLVGSGRRAKAGPPLRAFVDGLLAQRASSTPPDRTADPADLDCAQPQETWTYPLGDPTGLTAAVFCVGRPEQPEQARRSVISAKDLETLVASIRSDSGPPRATFGCGGFDTREPWLVGTNAWGDPITLTKECLDFVITDDLAWKPHGAAFRLVHRLISRAR
jgi:hypothetical protein